MKPTYTFFPWFITRQKVFHTAVTAQQILTNKKLVFTSEVSSQLGEMSAVGGNFHLWTKTTNLVDKNVDEMISTGILSNPSLIAVTLYKALVINRKCLLVHWAFPGIKNVHWYTGQCLKSYSFILWMCFQNCVNLRAATKCQNVQMYFQ